MTELAVKGESYRPHVPAGFGTIAVIYPQPGSWPYHGHPYSMCSGSPHRIYSLTWHILADDGVFIIVLCHKTSELLLCPVICEAMIASNTSAIRLLAFRVSGEVSPRTDWKSVG